jgi:hypothetical protein
MTDSVDHAVTPTNDTQWVVMRQPPKRVEAKGTSGTRCLTCHSEGGHDQFFSRSVNILLIGLRLKYQSVRS